MYIKYLDKSRKSCVLCHTRHGGKARPMPHHAPGFRIGILTITPQGAEAHEPKSCRCQDHRYRACRRRYQYRKTTPASPS